MSTTGGFVAAQPGNAQSACRSVARPIDQGADPFSVPKCVHPPSRRGRAVEFKLQNAEAPRGTVHLGVPSLEFIAGTSGVGAAFGA